MLFREAAVRAEPITRSAPEQTDALVMADNLHWRHAEVVADGNRHPASEVRPTLSMGAEGGLQLLDGQTAHASPNRLSPQYPETPPPTCAMIDTGEYAELGEYGLR